jgi:ABC transport system ATP-binding/permease protein
VEEGKRLKLLEKELAWARRSPPARTGKQKARRARAWEMADAQRERDRTRVREVEMEVQASPRLGRTVLEARGIGKPTGTGSWSGISPTASRPGSGWGSWVPTGRGRRRSSGSSWERRRRIPGEVVLGENTRIAYLDQLRDWTRTLTVARAVSDQDWVELGGRRMHLRAYLDRFLFPAHVQEQKVRSLSGGERNRILLARLFLQEANLLVLDEPTNDLDLDTLQVLEERIEEFPGCILLVTHDRFLLDKVATSLLVFEGEGRVFRHHGSWDTTWAAGRRSGPRRNGSGRRRSGPVGRPGPRRPGARPGRPAPERKAHLSGSSGNSREWRSAWPPWKTEKETLGGRLADPQLYQGDGGEEVAASRSGSRRRRGS